MKKSWWLLALILGMPVAYAGPLEVLDGVWQKILSVGDLSFIGISGTVPFTRILIWILCFTLFFAVASVLSTRKDGQVLFKRAQAIVVAAVLATISAVFLPASAILAVGAGWATAVGLLLIGGPIFGYWYFIWKWPGKDQETRMTVIIKLILSMILFWILSAMNSEVKIVGPSPSPSVAGTMTQFLSWALFIVSLMIIWYIVKIFWVTSSADKTRQEQEWGEKGANMREWLSNKLAERKQKEQMERRERNVLPAKSYLVKAIEDCEKLSRALLGGRNPEKRSLAASASQDYLNSLQKNLKAAVRELKYLRRREKGKVFEVFDNLYSVAGAALSKAENVDLPKSTAPDWDRAVGMVNAVVMGDQGIRVVCGEIINRLDIFIEAQNAEALQAVAVRRTEQQVHQQAAEERAAASGSPARGRLTSRPAGVVRRRR